MTYLSTPSLGDKLFYEHSLWSIAGHPGSGKSMIMLAIAIDHIKAGRHVVYIDFENGETRLRRRLWALQARFVKGFTERFHYIPKPILALKDFTTDLEAVGDMYPEAFVVIDSLRGLMAMIDPNEKNRQFSVNDTQTIERAEGPILDAVHSRDITVGIIDHATKAGSDDDRYGSLGSGAKQAIVDVEYFLTDEEHFSKQEAGVVKVTVNKDRDGELVEEHYWSVGGNGSGPLVFEAMDADDYQAPSDRGRRDVTRERIRSAIELALANEDLNVTAIREQVAGANTTINEILKFMTDEGALRVITDGQKVTYHLVRDPS